MIHTAPTENTQLTKPILPGWIMNSPGAETAEDTAFASGSALALLHVVLHDPNINVPIKLLRNRLALRAAVHCLKLEGRGQTEADIRDAYLLTAPGDAMGSAGDMLALWRTGSSLSLRSSGWRDRLQGLMPEDMQEHFANWMEQTEYTSGSPVTKAALDLPRFSSVSLNRIMSIKENDYDTWPHRRIPPRGCPYCFDERAYA